LQILLAHADLALRPREVTGEIVISPRKVFAGNLNRNLGVLSGGLLEDFSQGTWVPVDANVSSFALSPFGTVFYALESSRNLKQLVAGTSTLVDSGVTWFGLGSDGATVNVLETGGNLYQIKGASRTLLDQGVQSCTIDTATWTLIATETGGGIRRFAT
jgi:hypothetical protein